MKVIYCFLFFALFFFVFSAPVHAITLTPGSEGPVDTWDNYNIEANVLDDFGLDPIGGATVLFNISNKTDTKPCEERIYPSDQNLIEYPEEGLGIYCSGDNCDVEGKDPQAPLCEWNECNYTVCLNASKTGFKEGYGNETLMVRCRYNLTLVPKNDSWTGMNYLFNITAKDNSTCLDGGSIDYIIEKNVTEYVGSCSAKLLNATNSENTIHHCRPVGEIEVCNITVPRREVKNFNLSVILSGEGLCAVNLTITDPRGDNITSGIYTLGYCETPQIFNLKYSGNRYYSDLSAFTCYMEEEMGLNCSMVPNRTVSPDNVNKFVYKGSPGYVTGRINYPEYNWTLISEDGPDTCDGYNHTGDTTLNCTAYNITNATTKTEEIRTFRILDFELSGPDVNISTTVGKPFVLPVKITNRGLFTDNYSVSTTSPDSILVERGLKYTASLSTNETANIPFRTIVVVYTGQPYSICINTTSNIPIASAAERYLKVNIKAGEANLPEFGWFGIVQIIIFAGVVFFLVNFKY